MEELAGIIFSYIVGGMVAGTVYLGRLSFKYWIEERESTGN